MRKNILLIISCFSFTVVFANENPENEQIYFPHQAFFGESFLNQPMFLTYGDKNQRLIKTNYHSKSPQKGFLFSLTVPGLGEIYSQSKIKGFVFLGIEAAAWVSYFFHRKKGNNWKQQYSSFAENEWDQNKWQNWWNSLSSADKDRFPRYELPESKTDEYYEMIGKYNKYNAGWKDVNWIPGLYTTDISKASLYYMDLRRNSNSEFKLASASTAIIFANHILSSLDAVWSVKKFNKNFKASSKLEYVLIDDQPAIVAGVSVDW